MRSPKFLYSQLIGARTVARVGLILTLAGMSLAPASLAFADTPMRFGVDAASASKAIALGLPVTYGSLWAGAWNQRWGWDGIRTQLEAAKASGVTPVLQWWYWGDDISPDCVEHGCWDARQGVRKDKATWYRLSNELADLVVATMGSGNAVVIIETEFNKNGIETYEPFDAYLAEHVRIFHDRRFPVVVSFGNWGESAWSNFGRATAAADMLGTEVLQSSIHEASTYLSGVDMLISAARRLGTLFRKPCFVTDFAFSSYPEPSYGYYQDTMVKTVFARMAELKAAGVSGMVWRMLSDDPTFDTSNYHGMAERSWGLLQADGTPKLAFRAFVNGMMDEQSSPAPTATTPTSLRATAADRAATLSWVGSESADAYNVKFSTTSGGPYQTVAIEVKGTSFVQKNLVNGVTYFFRVSSSTASGESLDSNEASATPTAPTAPTSPTTPGRLTVSSPGDGAKVSGTLPFAAALENAPLATYRMYWQVDGGQHNPMNDSLAGTPHKEASVNVTSWNWRGDGPYVLSFVAESIAGQMIAGRQVTIYVSR